MNPSAGVMVALAAVTVLCFPAIWTFFRRFYVFNRSSANLLLHSIELLLVKREVYFALSNPFISVDASMAPSTRADNSVRLPNLLLDTESYSTSNEHRHPPRQPLSIYNRRVVRGSILLPEVFMCLMELIFPSENFQIQARIEQTCI